MVLIFFGTLIGYLAYNLLQQRGQESVEKAPMMASPDSKSEGLDPIGSDNLSGDERETLDDQSPSKVENFKVKGMPVQVADMRSMELGEELSFFVPQEDQQYAGVIDEVIISAAGSKSLTGMFDIEGTEYRFVFTVGGQHTFGTLHTPLGRYQLQAVNGVGTLVSASDISAKRDYSVPDYIVPEFKKLDVPKGS